MLSVRRLANTLLGVQRDELLRLLLDRRGAILGWIAIVLPDRAAGEDVFQETLIRASAEAERFEHPGHALAWVRSTARNLAHNEFRRPEHRAVRLDDRTLQLLESEWTHDLSDREEFERLEHCLEQLSPAARTLVRLRFVDGLTGETIAQRVGKTLAAVHTGLSRTYKALAGCMQQTRLA